MAGNRDEFHARPTAPLSRWNDAPHVMGGRDLRSGGGWAGVGADGRMAVVTNVRDPQAAQTGASRGALVADFLRADMSAAAAADHLAPDVAGYPPFNLLLADAETSCYLGNHPVARATLRPGVHGMSNGPLDAPWPKTRRLMDAVATWCATDAPSLDRLWDALADEHRPDPVDLPDTGIGLQREQWLGAAFIRGAEYGTRASTIILIDHAGEGTIHERRFGPMGISIDSTQLDF